MSESDGSGLPPQDMQSSPTVSRRGLLRAIGLGAVATAVSATHGAELAGAIGLSTHGVDVTPDNAEYVQKNEALQMILTNHALPQKTKEISDHFYETGNLADSSVWSKGALEIVNKSMKDAKRQGASLSYLY